MPIISPNRLAPRLTRLWYQTDEDMHGPVIHWLETSGARPHIEKFCSRLLAKAATEAIQREVPKRTMVVQVNLNLKKAATTFWQNIPEATRKGLTPNVIQMAIEMLFEEAGYDVENGTLSWEHHVPPLRQSEEDEEQIEVAPAPPQISEAPREDPNVAALLEEEDEDDEEEDEDEDEDDEDDEDDEVEEHDEDPEDEVENKDDPPVEPDVVTFEESPVHVGSVYSNGNGIHRRVDTMAEGKVTYTVVQGKGNVKTGQTGESSYKSFISWAKEAIPTVA